MAWAYGETVLQRYGRGGQVRFLRVGRVIADDADGVTLWIERDSPQIESVLPDGRSVRALSLAERFDVERERRPATWRGPGIVVFVPVAAAYSVWWFFAEDGGFAGWYGNLESPSVRWEADGLRGIDSRDHALDVWVEPDGTARWKDEDEFAVLTGRPDRWSAAEAVGIRATGEKLIALAAAKASPFDGRWTDFRPDPGWTLPELPAGWDRPHLAVT